MLKTSVIGFPRIGVQRELKWLVEGYFSGKISREDLTAGTRKLRHTHWKMQQSSGIDYIPSNDFSLYDTFLDMAYLLNVIPKRYQSLKLDQVDTYFAMARGFQDGQHDVKALEMKKWFNTNYHYIVPEIEDGTEFGLNGSKPFDEYQEALEIGITTKPVILGPFSFLKLCKNKSSRSFASLLADIMPVYSEIFNRLNLLKVNILQIDEPALVLDLDSGDIKNFTSAYMRLLLAKGAVQILLQTYFGDIRDIYKQLMQLDFDAIGLDLIDGRENLNLIKENGFPTDKLLFAGIVNGKNVWANDYARSLEQLAGLQEEISKERLVISTSCSLLHVPYTIQNESKMAAEHKEYLAFAEEKLVELKDLSVLAINPYYSENIIFISRKSLLEDKANRYSSNLPQDITVNGINSDDVVRQPPYPVRKEIQKEVLNLPLLPATTIGSFPQTAAVRNLRSSKRKGLITEEEYKQQIKQYIQELIKAQEELGLDVLVHGEYERNDMVEYFGENLEGFIFSENAWVQSYGTRGVKPPIIFGDVRRSRPFTVEWVTYAQSLTDKPVKGMLTGPITILNWSFPREDISLAEIAVQIALAIKDEVMDLEAAGIRIIQIDEAALREKLPLRKADWHKHYLDWAIPAFRLVHSSVKPETQIHTHMCYSEFADILKEIEAMDADVYTFEAARSDLGLLDALGRYGFSRQVGPGVYDIHSPRIPAQEEIYAILKTMGTKLRLDDLWVNPDCGLKTRKNEETFPSLRNMVNATRQYREELTK